MYAELTGRRRWDLATGGGPGLADVYVRTVQTAKHESHCQRLSFFLLLPPFGEITTRKSLSWDHPASLPTTHTHPPLLNLPSFSATVRPGDIDVTGGWLLCDEVALLRGFGNVKIRRFLLLPGQVFAFSLGRFLKKSLQAKNQSV